MSTINLKSVYAFAREYHPKKSDKFIQYGTAGFRIASEYLDHVCTLKMNGNIYFFFHSSNM